MQPGLTRPLKVNDMVYSKRFGYGQVTHISPDRIARYPYTVRFSGKENTFFTEIFSINGVYQISRPNINTDLAGPLKNNGTLDSTTIVAKVKQVENSENKKVEGTIIDIDGCKIFRSGDSMVVLPQNDDL